MAVASSEARDKSVMRNFLSKGLQTTTSSVAVRWSDRACYAALRRDPNYFSNRAHPAAAGLNVPSSLWQVGPLRRLLVHQQRLDRLASGARHVYAVVDCDRGQVAADHQGPAIGGPGAGNQGLFRNVRDRRPGGEHDVRIDREFRFRQGEDAAGLLG